MDNETKQPTVSNPLEHVVSLQYYDHIIRFFELFFESWMDENDKLDFINTVLLELNLDFKKLNDDIKIGVSNGYSVDSQIEMLRKMIAN